jgi:DNA-binding MarR family transcriptional regulator
MMMNIFDGLEKLINEHGSATILKERLLLASDKFKALEEKNVELVKANESLSKKLSAFESENALLKSKIVKDNNEANSIPKEQEKILEMISHSDDTYEEQIVSQTGLNQQTVKYHIDELKLKKYIQMKIIMISDPFSRSKAPNIYFITKEGRKYLFDNNLLS